MEESLFDKLSSYSNSDYLPMHMPGHKRNPRFASNFPGDIDITEIDGFDNMHNPRGVLMGISENASKLWGSYSAYPLINGSTAGILSAIRSVCHTGDRILVANNCHMSVWHAIELCRLKPIVVSPERIEMMPFCGAINPDDVLLTLTRFFDDSDERISAIVITSPTYEGIISDVSSIVAIAHSFDIPVIIDEAHGAHLGVSRLIDQVNNAPDAKADIVIKSLHKTLQCPTQTAILLTYRFDDYSIDRRGNGFGIDSLNNRIKHNLDIFQTSSPSYIFLSAIDSCLRELIDCDTCCDPWINAVINFKNRAGIFNNISVFVANDSRIKTDFSKIVITGKSRAINGFKFMSALRTRDRIELEAAFSNHVIAMTGIGDDDASLLKFFEGCMDIDQNAAELGIFDDDFNLLNMYNADYKFAEAKFSPINVLEDTNKLVDVPVEKSSGLIAGEFIWAYPPGIPLVIPGMKISPSTMAFIASRQSSGMAFERSSDLDTYTLIKVYST